MSESLSSIIGILLVIVLLILLPLYNMYERQDDMVYEFALNKTISFVDDVRNKGYITLSMYNGYITELAKSGVWFDVEMEAKIKNSYTNSTTLTNDVLYEVDYTKQILEFLNNQSSNNPIDNVYRLKKDDYFYVRIQNTNITQASLIFNILGGKAEAGKISINYGGMVKDSEWLEEEGQIYIPVY